MTMLAQTAALVCVCGTTTACVLQAWANMSKMPPQQAATGFVRLNSGIKTVFSPHQ